MESQQKSISNNEINSQGQNRGFKNDRSAGINSARFHPWDKTFSYRINLLIDPSE